MMEGSWSANDVRDQSKNWSLEGDAKLLYFMESISKNIEQRCQTTVENINRMVLNVDGTNIAFGNTINKLSALQHSQFVENRVYEEDETSTDDKESIIPRKTDNSKQNLLPIHSIQLAIDNGMSVLHKRYEKVSLDLDDSENEDDEHLVTNVVFRAKDEYINQTLPYIIGTKEWKEKWHVGMLESDFESDNENEVEEFSDTASSNQSSPSISITSNAPTISESEGSVWGLNSTLEIQKDLFDKPLNDDEIAESITQNVYQSEKPMVFNPNEVLAKHSIIKKRDEIDSGGTSASIDRLRNEESPPTIFRDQPAKRKIVNLFDEEPPKIDYPIPAPRSQRKTVNLFTESDDETDIFSHSANTKRIDVPNLFENTPPIDNLSNNNKLNKSTTNSTVNKFDANSKSILDDISDEFEKKNDFLTPKLETSVPTKKNVIKAKITNLFDDDESEDDLDIFINKKINKKSDFDKSISKETIPDEKSITKSSISSNLFDDENDEFNNFIDKSKSSIIDYSQIPNWTNNLDKISKVPSSKPEFLHDSFNKLEYKEDILENKLNSKLKIIDTLDTKQNRNDTIQSKTSSSKQEKDIAKESDTKIDDQQNKNVTFQSKIKLSTQEEVITRESNSEVHDVPGNDKLIFKDKTGLIETEPVLPKESNFNDDIVTENNWLLNSNDQITNSLAGIDNTEVSRKSISSFNAVSLFDEIPPDDVDSNEDKEESTTTLSSSKAHIYYDDIETFNQPSSSNVNTLNQILLLNDEPPIDDYDDEPDKIINFKEKLNLFKEENQSTKDYLNTKPLIQTKKIDASKLNIKVDTLLPGATSTVFNKKNIQSMLSVDSVIPEVDPDKVLNRIEKSPAAISSNILTSLNKSRPKFQGKRQPPTRKGLEDNFRKYSDHNTVDTLDKSLNVSKSEPISITQALKNYQNTVDPGLLEEDEQSKSKEIDGLVSNSNLKDDNILPDVVKSNAKNYTDSSDDDDDFLFLFDKSKNKTKLPTTKPTLLNSNTNIISNTKTDSLFSSDEDTTLVIPNLKLKTEIKKQKNLFSGRDENLSSKNTIASSSKPTNPPISPTAKSKHSNPLKLFDSDDDDDDSLFRTTEINKTISKKFLLTKSSGNNKLFDDSDENDDTDIFKSKFVNEQPKKQITGYVKKVIQTTTIIDDDPLADLLK